MNRDSGSLFNPIRAMPNRLRLTLVTTFGLIASLDAAASEDLARAKGCLTCHSVQAKIVGPAYKDVAAKYAEQPDAEDRLVQKVMKGGQGVWGFVPMPANANVSAEEAHTLVRWILSNQ